jgi:hypothetical protein
MIEDNGSASHSNTSDLLPVFSVTRNLLIACVSEAERQASAISDLDKLVGEVLTKSQIVTDAASLQKLDVLRQETEGLASLLRLVARQTAFDSPIVDRDIVDCAPLANQRERIAQWTK